MTTGKTIFIVDDDEDDLFFFEQALKRTDGSAQLIKVLESTEVIKTLKGDISRPDYIFLDLNMPKKSGKECLADIRNESVFHNIPVIIYTTSSSPEDRKEIFKMGANHFLTKFSDFKELCNTLSALVKDEMKLEIPVPSPGY